MTTREIVAAALISASISAAARARPSAKDEMAVRKLTYDYARCVVKKNHDLAARAIISNENNATIFTHYSALIDSDCLIRTSASDKNVSFAGDLYRYALADALVSKDFTGNGPTDFSDRLPLAHLLPPDRTKLDSELVKAKSASQRKELQASFDSAEVVTWLSRYGECVVRQDPVDSRLWLLTPPDGPEETSRINALRPTFSDCMKGETTLTFNRMTMRGTVALNYYRLAMATPVSTAAGKAN